VEGGGLTGAVDWDGEGFSAFAFSVRKFSECAWAVPLDSDTEGAMVDNLRRFGQRKSHSLTMAFAFVGSRHATP
jgi:hypothetical protein